MSLRDAIKISSQGLSVQRQRMQLVASNLANMSTTRADGNPQSPYIRRELVVEAKPYSEFGEVFNSKLDSDKDDQIMGVKATGIHFSGDPFIQKFDPDHPDANPNTGIVLYPNVDPAMEMVDMVSVTRSFEANAQAVRAARSMISQSIDLLRT